MGLGIVPTVDYAFKRLFGDPDHKPVLLHLLNAVLEGQLVVEDVEILTPFLEKEFEEDKLAILDLRLRDTDGRHYNLEMQTTAFQSLPSRLVYYLCGMHSEQLWNHDRRRGNAGCLISTQRSNSILVSRLFVPGSARS